MAQEDTVKPQPPPAKKPEEDRAEKPKDNAKKPEEPRAEKPEDNAKKSEKDHAGNPEEDNSKKREEGNAKQPEKDSAEKPEGNLKYLDLSDEAAAEMLQKTGVVEPVVWPEPEETEEEKWHAQRRKVPLKVDVEWLDFEHFKNRYSEKEGLAIIEVLCGHSKILQEIFHETTRRSRGIKKDVRVARPVPNLKPAVDGNSDSYRYWIQRVRIQSPQLILLLSRLTGHRNSWSTDQPRTFFSPFRAFYYYLPELTKCLDILRKRFGHVDGPDNSTLPNSATTVTTLTQAGSKPEQAASVDTADRGSPLGDEDDDAVEWDNPDFRPLHPNMALSDELASAVTLAHLETFVNFIEDHIASDWRRAAGTSQRKFRFPELLMAFQPGELLYSPVLSDSVQNSVAEADSNPKLYQIAWRLYAMSPDEIKDDKPDDTQKAKHALYLYAYHMDYNGNSYVPVRYCFNIKGYEGERDITSLKVYPLRFVKTADKIKDTLRKQGTRFREFITQRHLSYDGWTLPYGPVAESASSPLPVEHIDGDVMIDFVEGYKSEALATMEKPTEGLLQFDDSEWGEGDDDLSITHWRPVKDDGDQLEKFAYFSEKTQRAEWLAERDTMEQRNSRRALKAYSDGKRVTESDLEEDDLLLLPRRVVAYTFRERRFVLLDTDSLTPLPKSSNVFDDLRINPRHKQMVRSLVQSHFDKEATQRLRPNLSLSQDIFRGKGSGLVILLHGVPGVGKTATAEAVAQANNKPLFVITCGDLGFAPADVEDSLKNIFRLAQLWNCVLLLDEADIFLSRRQLNDLKRNALVSVFLRVLEYYSGVLFLTTNRVGTLDEAFKSRIHLSLYYPPLDWQQTMDIFKLNIRKLQENVNKKHKLLDEELGSNTPKPPKIVIDGKSILSFANDHWNRNEAAREQRWNGRQIRNAFQIAYSLAEFDMNNTVSDQGENNTVERGTPRRVAGNGRLDRRQFEMVAEAIQKFEDYLYSATNGTDSDRARKEFIREDDYYEEQQWPRDSWGNSMAYRPPAPSRQITPSDRRQGQGNAYISPRGYNRPMPAGRPDLSRPAPVPGEEQFAPVSNMNWPKLQGGMPQQAQQRRLNVPSGAPPGPAQRQAKPPARPGGTRRVVGQVNTPGEQYMASRGNNHSMRPAKSPRPAASQRNDSRYHSGLSTSTPQDEADMDDVPQDWEDKEDQGGAADGGDDDVAYQHHGDGDGLDDENDLYGHGGEEQLDDADMDQYGVEGQDEGYLEYGNDDDEWREY